MSGSQGEGSASAKRNYKSDTLRPVTIKQLLDAHHPNPDAEYFMIDDAEATQVTFVAQIRNISTQTTNVTYKMDDGTGIVEVKQWIDAEALSNPDDPSNQRPKPQEQAYARVYGKLKSFNNKRHVGAMVVRPITDYNEINYHLLEATVVHLHFTRGPQPGQAGAGAGAGADASMASNGYAPQIQQNGGGGGDATHMSSSSRKMLACLRQTPQTNEGMNATAIANMTGMELGEVYKAGEELTILSKVYTTLDDTTWALLDI